MVHLTPVRIDGLTDAVEIDAGESFACARRADGSVWCWGANHLGQLGNGGGDEQYAPVAVQWH